MPMTRDQNPRSKMHATITAIIRWFDAEAGNPQPGKQQDKQVDWLRILPLIGIHVMQTVHVLKHVQYKFSNGIELKRIFQQTRLLEKLSKELAAQLRKKEKTLLIRQTLSESMIVFGVWHVFLFVLHRLSKLINLM